jgi:hypothetical protein
MVLSRSASRSVMVITTELAAMAASKLRWKGHYATF